MSGAPADDPAGGAPRAGAGDLPPVAIDLTPLLAGSTGVARYAGQLAAALSGAGVTLLPFAVGRGGGRLPDATRRLPVPLRVVQASWRLSRLPRAEQLAPGAGLTHSLDLVPPPTRLPLVVTLHDVAAVEHPELHGRRAVRQQRAQLAAAAHADAVIANSGATAAAAARHGVDPGRITVTPLGVTPLDTTSAPGSAPSCGAAAPAAAGASVPAPYVLCVGEVAPRKGVELAVEALARTGRTDTRLVVAGPLGAGTDAVRAAAERTATTERVVVLGAVDDGRLAALYDGAAALCFPSRAEGFGLPVLEAMARGVPVVASDLPAVREVAADAAVLVPPGDVDALAAALTTVLDDADLRCRLGAAGRARAAGHTWEATAAATIAAYRKVLGCG